MTYVPAHLLSTKSTRQRRNVFIWCASTHRLAMGWRVDGDSPVTVYTAYRWVTTSIVTQHPTWEAADSYALFPVALRPNYVLTYSVHQNGLPLSRESQDLMVPGDYALYDLETRSELRIFRFLRHTPSYLNMRTYYEANVPALAAKALMTPFLARRALARDGECVFSGVQRAVNSDSDGMLATWIFPPFLGYELSDDPSSVQHMYQDNPEKCNLSEFMAVENVVSTREDLVTLFCDNKLGVDVDDNYRIVLFEGPECLNGVQLKSHLTVDQPNRPSDKFLRLHFRRCLTFSACRGDVTADYKEQEIENFMEELGVFDNEMDFQDAKWQTPLGVEVHAYLIREKMAQYAEEEVLA